MMPDIPGYTLLREIGKGGMGIVYRARRESDSAEVAIKILPPNLITPTTAKRFRREGQALMAVDHPNVVKVFAVDCHEGLHYIAMEFLSGKPLSRLIRANPKGVPLDTGVRFGVQVGRALSVIHERGMIHRDLKPGNVMVLDESGIAKLLDFGLVHVEGLTMLTATGSILGTPLYMSPEQCSGSALDLRTDVYSFGVLLFHLFTGAPPFQSASAYELLQMQQNEIPPSPTQIRKDLPSEIGQIILRCLEKDPQDRYLGVDEPVARLTQLAEERGFSLDAAALVEQVPSEAEVGPGGARSRRGNRALRKTLLALTAVSTMGLLGFHPGLADLRARAISALEHCQRKWFDSVASAEEFDTKKPMADPVAPLPVPEIDDPLELDRLARSHWDAGRDLEAAGDLASAYEKYLEATRLYPRSAYLRKLIDLAPQLDRHGEVRAIIRECLRRKSDLDRDGSFRQYLGGEA